MDLQKIEQLLKAYFEGKTSVADEKNLQQYFKSDEVAPHLEVYKDMFAFFATAKSEKIQITPEFATIKKQSLLMQKNKWYGVAALLVVALGITFFMQNNSNTLSQAEQFEAEMAFEKTREALNFFSYYFNESAQKLAFINEFEKSTNKIFK